MARRLLGNKQYSHCLPCFKPGRVARWDLQLWSLWSGSRGAVVSRDPSCGDLISPAEQTLTHGTFWSRADSAQNHSSGLPSCAATTLPLQGVRTLRGRCGLWAGSLRWTPTGRCWLQRSLALNFSVCVTQSEPGECVASQKVPKLKKRLECLSSYPFLLACTTEFRYPSRWTPHVS